ncbi:DNA mismatch repair protein MutS [Chitinophaga sp. Cy-1792]|uniref:MutS-related protein n=1 Tax=Chitinophaga sp. Cy-1792 TaxID=2608339 RepID=UPI001422E907|nr:DNA mismatch repair protein MutS [Chitinophaga sp. Cy-1792]NIG55642.1 DNA mismatch repair protein MutS [Chitinophaga sp. Cy-1792]
MPYFLIFLFFALGAVLLYTNQFRRSKSKQLLRIRQQWGKPKEGPFHFSRIRSFLDVNSGNDFQVLSDQTKADIDFDEVFCFADRTLTPVGQQYLYDLMSKPGNDAARLQLLEQQVSFFTNNTTERETAQVLLTALQNNDAAYISSLLEDDIPSRPSWYNMVKVSLAAMLLMLVLSPFYPFLLIGLPIPLFFNVFLHYWNKNNTARFIRSVPQLAVLMEQAHNLSGHQLPFNNTAAIESLQRMKTFRRKSLFINFGHGESGDDLTKVFAYLLEYLKAFLLVEFFAFYALVDELRKRKPDILVLFNYIGSIDTCISIASLRAGDTHSCTPDFLPVSRTLEATKVCHPPIPGCVPNDITVNGKSVLITGSNMSGKTTFLRTIALNIILAQTIHTCFATSFRTPFFRLFSSIRIDDSLQDGRSYYFQEVEVMHSLIREVTPSAQNFYILDEVFKGTNTVERIAAASAILSYLNKYNNIVFVSTHDIELSAMLSADYELYHFSETVSEGQLSFDHKLKTGQLTTRNAIKLLEISGYPKEIIDQATGISSKLRIQL